MGLSETIKQNSRRISDACAGTTAYFNLATTNLSLYRAISRAADAHARGALLDAGAGRMAYKSILASRADSYESLDAAPLPGINHVADLRDTGLPEAHYDSIFCTQVLQHLPDPGRAIAEMARLLKPGGQLVITVPHMVWMHNEPHDYWRFTDHGTRRLAEQAGLRIIKTERLGGLICFLAYAPSTLCLALAWPVRPAWRVALFLNKAFIRLALCADRIAGMSSLYPTNIMAIAEKPA